MYFNETYSENRLNIFVEDVDVPDDLTAREEFVEMIEATLGEVLRHKNRDPERIKIFTTHTYTQISDRCPQCNDNLVIPYLEPEVGLFAYAKVSCRNCSWSGRAVYTLIDYHEEINLENPGEGNEAVRKYDLNPSYFPL